MHVCTGAQYTKAAILYMYVCTYVCEVQLAQLLPWLIHTLYTEVVT